MQRLLKILPFIALGYVFISCFCKGPELDELLIKNSSLIFEGTITKIDTMPQDSLANNLKITFKILKVYKGEKLDFATIKTSNGDCGLLQNPDSEEVGRQYLIYTKENMEIMPGAPA